MTIVETNSNGVDSMNNKKKEMKKINYWGVEKRKTCASKKKYKYQ